jgi:hypothetical protein
VRNGSLRRLGGLRNSASYCTVYGEGKRERGGRTSYQRDPLFGYLSTTKTSVG